MSRTLPQPGDHPRATNIAMVRLYATASKTTDCDSDFDVEVTAPASTGTGTDTDFELFVVSSGVVLHDIWAEMVTSWGADSDVISWSIGDCTAVDTWYTDTQIAPAGTDASGIFKSKAYAAGTARRYDTADRIDAHLTFYTSAGAATGLCLFYAVYSLPQTWGYAPES